MQVNLVLSRDPAAAPVTQGVNPLGAKLFGGVANQVKETQAIQKDNLEYLKKLKEISNKPAAEQIKLLKIFINEQEMKNKQLITRQLKLSKDFEKLTRKVDEAKKAKPLPPKPSVPTDKLKEFSDVNKLLSGIVFSKGDANTKNST